MTHRHRWQRWLGWWALVLGCATDNDDGCSETEDCPPPCLTGTVAIDFVAEPDPGVPLPGSGTWHFDLDLDGRAFSCTVRPGEDDCTDDDVVRMIGTSLELDRGPSTLEVTVRYVDIAGVESVVLHEEIEPDYALPSEASQSLCGNCPHADVELVLPVEGLVG